MKAKLPSFACLAGLFVASPLALLAQDAAPLVNQKTLLQELSVPAIWPLWVCSAVIVYLVIDLYLKTARKQMLPDSTVGHIRNFFREGDYQNAYNWTAANPGPVSNVVNAGLHHCSGGKQATEDAMAAAIVGENTKFQGRIAYLSVIGVIAPMIGLTGTVIGMIQAFAAMGQAGAADPSKLSGAIGHVLHATASGLVVAIPAFVFYYLIRNRVSYIIHDLSVTANDLFRRFPYEAMADVELELVSESPAAAEPASDEAPDAQAS